MAPPPPPASPQESNAGNLVADCLRYALHGDCCLINGGLLRADAIQGPGPYTVKNLVDLLPMATQAVMLEVPGALFPSILNNAVCKFPVLEGRFGQVSGLSFDFDSDLPPGSRVLLDTIKVAGDPLDKARRYKFVTTAYLSLGKDGYDAFADPSVKILIDEENGVTVPTVLRNYFRESHVIGAFSSRMANAGSSRIAPVVKGRITNIRGDPRVTKQDKAALQIQRIARARQSRAMVRAKKALMVEAAGEAPAALTAAAAAAETDSPKAETFETIMSTEFAAQQEDGRKIAELKLEEAKEAHIEAINEDTKHDAEAEAAAAAEKDAADSRRYSEDAEAAAAKAKKIVDAKRYTVDADAAAAAKKHADSVAIAIAVFVTADAAEEAKQHADEVALAAAATVEIIAVAAAATVPSSSESVAVSTSKSMKENPRVSPEVSAMKAAPAVSPGQNGSCCG